MPSMIETLSSEGNLVASATQNVNTGDVSSGKVDFYVFGQAIRWSKVL